MIGAALRLLLVVAVALAVGAGRPALAQVVATEQRTPAGLVFHHIALPDTHHTLAVGWLEARTYVEPGKENLPSVAARLVMEGTADLNESGRVEALRDLQGSIGLSGGDYATRAVIAAPVANFAQVAQLFGAMIRTPALPERKLRRHLRTSQISWTQVSENAEALAMNLFLRLVLGDAPLYRSLTGNPAGQSAITVADVAAWREDVLARRPNTLVSAGPLSPELVGREIDRMFASARAALGQWPAAPALRSPGRLIVLEKPDAVQTAIVAGGPTRWEVGLDAILGSMSTRVLGGGFESRLMRSVREGLGAAYGIRAGFQQVHLQNLLLNITTQVDNTKAVDAVAAIRREYAKLYADGVTTAEIEPLKTRLVVDMREQMRRSTGAAQSTRDRLLAGFPVDFPMQYEARVKTVTADEVTAAIRSKMPRPPLLIVIVAPSAAGLGADCVLKAATDIAQCE